MKRVVFIIILIAAVAIAAFATVRLCSNCRIAKAVRSQIDCYPESTLKDLYKSFFQDAFGPGHLMSSGEDAVQGMREYLKQECEEAKGDVNLCPDYELTGHHGRFYRVNLSLINDGIIPFETFLSAFIKSAETYALPDLDDWKTEWNRILSVITRVAPDLPSFDEDKALIDKILADGNYASHHSERYNAKYHPHYRLIERNIFESEILPLIGMNQ